MGFKVFKSTTTEDGAIQLTESLPIVFSGPKGLIAQWANEHRELATRSWSVEPEEWLVMANLVTWIGSSLIVFEQEDYDGGLHYAKLLGVTGVCHGDKTELAFILEPMITLQSGATPLLRLETKKRVWTEELALEGSPFNRISPWRWCKPKMAIGSATVGGRA